jgi:hypothetical protein
LPLYPDVPQGDVWVLCAGEWDALAARQAGLPAVTGLCGCLWLAAWNSYALGKRIGVLYDVGEEEAAAVTTERLKLAGAEAWPVGLPSDKAGYDVCDFFLEGHTAKELLALVRRARI